MLFQLFFNNAPISNQTSSCHIVLILEVEYLLLQLIYGGLDLTFFLNNFMQLPTFFESIQFLQFLLVVIYNFFVIDELSIVDILTRGLRFGSPFSLFLLLFQVDIDYFLEFLQHLQ